MLWAGLLRWFMIRFRPGLHAQRLRQFERFDDNLALGLTDVHGDSLLD